MNVTSALGRTLKHEIELDRLPDTVNKLKTLVPKYISSEGHEKLKKGHKETGHEHPRRAQGKLERIQYKLLAFV